MAASRPPPESPLRLLQWCLLLAASAARAQSPEGLFPELYGVPGREPPQIVARHELTAADEQPKDARNVISNETVKNPDHLPLGPNSRIVATFTSQPGKGPLKVVLDWAGYEVGTPEGPRDGMVVANLFFACEGTNDRCGPDGRTGRTEVQEIFYVPPIQDRTAVGEVVIDGKPRKIFVGHGELVNDVPADLRVAVHLSFNSPRHFETYRLRTTLVYGDYTTQRPVEPVVPKPWWRVATVAALLALAIAWWRRSASDEPFDSDDPPKVLGMLVRALGLLWAIAGMVFIDTYSMVLGVLMALAGGFLYYGRSLAVPAFWLLVGVAWVWSFREVGTNWKLLAPRVGLVTILWLWVAFGGTAARLGTREDHRLARKADSG